MVETGSCSHDESLVKHTRCLRSPTYENLRENSSTKNSTSVKIFRKTIDNILSLVNTSADRKDFPLFHSTNIAILRRDLAQCLKITILYISRTDT